MSIDAQVRFATTTIPGMEENQTKLLLEEAFRRNSTVVIGGSRARVTFGLGVFRPDSDLDVGFGNLTSNQAGRIIRLVSKVGPLELEKTRFVPGNQTANIPLVQSPEEFFQRSGTRSGNDPNAGQPFGPSGSYTFCRDGSIVIIPPGGNPTTLLSGSF
jgi:hypothetical protein